MSNSTATNGIPDRPAPEGFQWIKVRKPGIEGDIEWVLWQPTVITISGQKSREDKTVILKATMANLIHYSQLILKYLTNILYISQ